MVPNGPNQTIRPAAMREKVNKSVNLFDQNFKFIAPPAANFLLGMANAGWLVGLPPSVQGTSRNGAVVCFHRKLHLAAVASAARIQSSKKQETSEFSDHMFFFSEQSKIHLP